MPRKYLNKIIKKIEGSIKGFTDKSFLQIKITWKRYLIPEVRLIILSIIFMIIASGLEALSVKMLQPVFDEVFISKNRAILNIIGLQIILIFAVKGIANYFQHIYMAKVGLNMVKKMQVDLFAHLMSLDISFFQRRSSGDLLNHFINDVNITKEAMLNGITSLVKDSCSVLFMIGLMFYKNAEMAAIMFILFPIAFWPLIHFGKKVRNMTSKQQMSAGGLFGSLAQAFQGIKIIKSYCLEDKETEKIKGNAEFIADISLNMTKINAILSPLMEFFGGIAVAGTLAYGGLRIMQGKLTPGSFMVFLLAIVAAYRPLKNLAGLNVKVQMGIAALNRLFKLYNEKPAILDSVVASPLIIKTGKIEVIDVKFSYISKIEVLHNISLVADPNKTTAIVGASGSGKSTLINLLLRFYDVESGYIKIDGQDLRDVSIKSLRENIAFVSQDVVLFDDTIKNNIIFGKKNVSDDEVIQAAKNAAAHSFIMKKDNGYDEMIGERGGKLSGGQKQMLSIARAMLKDAPILLLDEATSSLDSKSENIVQKSLEKLMEGRTTIVIAHRLATIINADKIFVFDNGNIVESGTHRELLAKGDYYAKLYNLQFLNKK
ncbi:MAG: ABC transporter ATP-binding protein/permease [Elusimicrobiota bacterium]|jgi:subfamily B ATP-binding cassette protein MsbA|nr:ABC transporter ATP-binding protein/permease [Elusimicrobiota bacterium]